MDISIHFHFPGSATRVLTFDRATIPATHLDMLDRQPWYGCEIVFFRRGMRMILECLLLVRVDGANMFQLLWIPFLSLRLEWETYLVQTVWSRQLCGLPSDTWVQIVFANKIWHQTGTVCLGVCLILNPGEYLRNEQCEDFGIFYFLASTLSWLGLEQKVFWSEWKQVFAASHCVPTHPVQPCFGSQRAGWTSVRVGVGGTWLRTECFICGAGTGQEEKWTTSQAVVAQGKDSGNPGLRHRVVFGTNVEVVPRAKGTGRSLY